MAKPVAPPGQILLPVGPVAGSISKMQLATPVWMFMTKILPVFQLKAPSAGPLAGAHV